VNLNIASVTDLHNALGISTTVARKIVTYRSAHGTFTAVSQLLLVPVSKATYDRINDLVAI
jgi:DNA uptake protein ComE-like DNA-binding protein